MIQKSLLNFIQTTKMLNNIDRKQYYRGKREGTVLANCEQWSCKDEKQKCKFIN